LASRPLVVLANEFNGTLYVRQGLRAEPIGH
jgi:hypothetical protein